MANYGTYYHDEELELDEETNLSVSVAIECTALGMKGSVDPYHGGYPAEPPEFEFRAFYIENLSDPNDNHCYKVNWGTLSDSIGVHEVDGLFDRAVEAAIESRLFDN